MKIEKNTAVTIRIGVSDTSGKRLGDGTEPMAYLHGGYDNIFPRLEQALEGQEAGFKTTLELQAADAFGLRDEQLAHTIPKSEFPPGVKVGGQLEGRGPDGSMIEYTV